MSLKPVNRGVGVCALRASLGNRFTHTQVTPRSFGHVSNVVSNLRSRMIFAAYDKASTRLRMFSDSGIVAPRFRATFG